MFFEIFIVKHNEQCKARYFKQLENTIFVRTRVSFTRRKQRITKQILRSIALWEPPCHHGLPGPLLDPGPIALAWPLAVDQDVKGLVLGVV